MIRPELLVQLRLFIGDARTIAVNGGQWGDEGKGKIVDLLAHIADVIARGTGGQNSGHTIWCMLAELLRKIAMHLIPCGIRQDARGAKNICGSGMVIHPAGAVEELKKLREHGLSYDQLRISHRARMVMPWHVAMDLVNEWATAREIGTTARGIGYAYGDHVLRDGLYIGDLYNERVFRERAEKSLKRKLRFFNAFPPELLARALAHERLGSGRYARIDPIDESVSFDLEKVITHYLELAQGLSPHVTDTDEVMRRALDDGEIVLLEGAQGAILSVEQGDFRHVTSSDSTLAGLCAGAGVPRWRNIDLSISVAKFYQTRVGGGPMPSEHGGVAQAKYCANPLVTAETELAEYPMVNINSGDPLERARYIRRKAHEYGTTTGRPRRVGMLDLVMLRHMARQNGPLIALTLVDVMDEAEFYDICTAYRYTGAPYRMGDRELRAGDVITDMSPDAYVMAHVEPITETLPGWKRPVGAIREWNELPVELASGIARIEFLAGTKTVIVSVGPEADQTIFRPNN